MTMSSLAAKLAAAKAYVASAVGAASIKDEVLAGTS